MAKNTPLNLGLFCSLVRLIRAELLLSIFGLNFVLFIVYLFLFFICPNFSLLSFCFSLFRIVVVVVVSSMQWQCSKVE